MAVRYIDGFEDYATAQLLLGNWNAIGAGVTIAAGAGRSGAALYCPQKTATKTLDAQSTWIVGFAVKFTSLAAGWFACLLDGATEQVTLCVAANNTLYIARGATSVGASIQTVSPNTWYYIEFKVTVADSIGAGTAVVRVNGETWITVATGSDLKATTNAYADALRLGNATAGYQYFDDLYILDGVAGPVAGDNDFLGDVRVDSLLPTGAGSTTAWTPDSSSNYARVNEAAPDETSYVSSVTVDQIDTYAMANLATTPAKIWAVQTGLVVRKMDAGSRSIAPVLRGADGDKVGTTRSVGDSYYNYQQVYEQNPLTTPADWTESSLNAIEMGIKLIA